MAAMYQTKAVKGWKNNLAARDNCSYSMIETIAWTRTGLLIQ